VTNPRPSARRRTLAGFVAPLLIAGVALAACGGNDSTTAATPADSTIAPTSADTAAASSATTEAAGELIPLTIGYSAWPGWFPLAVADQQGIFTDAGLDVDLTYFVDYTASLDALVAGGIDVNAQTLNDTIFAVASGAQQQIVVAGDNSTGNDAVICDASITSIDGLTGKTVAAEAGVVDHFLLLQGLDTVGLTEDDIDFQGVKTDAAAAAFAGGQFDCVAVFAPFTLQALEREGSHVLFSSKDFPGAIPDHLVASAEAATDVEAMQRLVNAWYATLDYITANPDESIEIMAEQAQVSVADYESFASGTTLFSADEALAAFADRAGDPTSLPEMARRINPFLVSSGLTETSADLTGLLEPTYTQAYVDATPG
jgi:NitT/TauT family transport system substrate-binding protein